MSQKGESKAGEQECGFCCGGRLYIYGLTAWLAWLPRFGILLLEKSVRETESSAQIKKMPFKSTSSHWNTGIRKSHIWKAVQRELSGVEMDERESEEKGTFAVGL